ncbi:linear amide C-N hydrolase [Cytophaga hutchinsonii]|uniref:Penicillin amidase, Cysteine peptidase, MEROPS family C59 n=1 Tax=Cytophaga hutchinsonii (strain ATCC 33406 / DSM 1761 / CIP 103989 / NBRC 15051 / NCIMB 9469 / D465) TaxID=269798 RepID=A0A6N4STU5_CYTH3|nr:linear amide C-N hydrolase [Cytophaga hutchinsonii]ABG59644.1 penicillin amidase, Cysteine peptidase, MEROPS family C59 [Cytophaga hutchinsonii ATCC 33406]SFX66680.1 choloylglycine hydrolase [Cytophaga hutchinsonii ATCC 33406]
MKRFFLKTILAAFCVYVPAILNTAYACTRIVYQGPNGTIITARSMDWKGEIPANLWIFPRGIERNGEAGSTSVKWKSTYGSVITSSWDIASSDGMNEKGLVGNLLWLVESTYPKFVKDKDKPGLAVSLWLQYVLDNFATVSEAVAFLEKEPFVVASSHIPGTAIFATVHLSISDATGDNAIFEYIGGKLVIHHDRSYVTMTNSPVFDEQLAINTYWKNIPGTVMLPGTNRAADRFVRASYYIDAIPKTDNTRVALPSVFSVIRNCSVPLGISSEAEPNISSTRWRTVSDQKNLVYYFDNVLNPNVVWVEFSKIDFSEKAKVKKLTLANNENYSGEASMNFKAALPFTFAGLD